MEVEAEHALPCRGPCQNSRQSQKELSVKNSADPATHWNLIVRDGVNPVRWLGKDIGNRTFLPNPTMNRLLLGK